MMLLEGTSRPHMLCMFNPGLSWKSAIDRCVGIIFALSQWNVSMRFDGDLDNAQCAGQVRMACEAVAKTMPFLTAHLTALKEGLPILKTMKVKEDEELEDEATAAEVRGGRQSVLKAIRDAPTARVMYLQSTKPKESKASTSKTRSSSSSDLDKAIELEKSSQDKATERAKRVRDDDVARAMAVVFSSKKSKPAVKVPREQAAKKSKETVDKPNVAGHPDADDEEPE